MPEAAVLGDEVAVLRTTMEGCSALAMVAASEILASDPPERRIAVTPSLRLNKYRTVWVLPVPGLP
ncbi:hypothetical protein NicSoilC12_30900 [Arthrobacter sp. NicSoilC12]|nr:hypothetical protein NicSoilC12_30900 [Arthrobacter sp. NicSoilC12]